MNDYQKLNVILDSTKDSLQSKNYFAALTTSMVLMDTCAKIEQPNEKSVKTRYAEWVGKYLLEKLKIDNPLSEYISKENIYYLRCALLHESSTNPSYQEDYLNGGLNFKKVHDIVPYINKGNSVENVDKIVEANLAGQSHPTLFIDINFFIEQILVTIETWLTLNHESLKGDSYHIFSLGYLKGNSSNNKKYFIR